MRGSLVVAALLTASTSEAQQFTWPTRQVTVSPSGRLGSEDDERALLTNVVGAVRLESGRILVGDGGNFRTVLFAPTGAVLWSAGRRGAGPGEFRHLNSIARCRDGSLAAFDGVAGSLTILTDSGTVHSTTTFPMGQQGRLIWCADGKNVVIDVQARLRAPPPPGRSLIRRHLFHVKGTQTDTVATGESDLYMSKDQRMMLVIPFGETVLTAAGGSMVYLCQGYQGRCFARDLATGQRDSFEIALPRPPLSTDEWDRHLREIVKPPSGVRDPREAQLLQLFREAKKPDTHPRFSAIVADVAGRLWVKADGGRWLIATRTGRPVATVTLPASLKLLDIGRDHLIGVTVDEDGVQQVNLFRFQPLPQ